MGWRCTLAGRYEGRAVGSTEATVSGPGLLRAAATSFRPACQGAYRDRATRLVALIQERLGLQAAMTPGKIGQYDVLLDGEVIASRERGLLKRLLGGGWPDPEAIVDEIQRRHEGRRTTQQARVDPS